MDNSHLFVEGNLFAHCYNNKALLSHILAAVAYSH